MRSLVLVISPIPDRLRRIPNAGETNTLLSVGLGARTPLFQELID